jgi:hypothetical protein
MMKSFAVHGRNGEINRIKKKHAAPKHPQQSPKQQQPKSQDRNTPPPHGYRNISHLDRSTSL